MFIIFLFERLDRDRKRLPTYWFVPPNAYSSQISLRLKPGVGMQLRPRQGVYVQKARLGSEARLKQTHFTLACRHPMWNVNHGQVHLCCTEPNMLWYMWDAHYEMSSWQWAHWFSWIAHEQWAFTVVGCAKKESESTSGKGNGLVMSALCLG